MKILLCALEPSADALGSSLMASLREEKPDIEFIGCGGPLMMAEGLQSLFDIAAFAVIGPGAALRLLPAALQAAEQLVAAAISERPAAVVFIDSWSFSKIAAQKFRRQAPDVKRIKYVAPQVWASRPKRAKTTAALFDGVLCLFQFETAIFKNAGARVCFVGHAGFQAAKGHQADNAAFRNKHDLGDAPLLAVLLGSRPAELRRHAKPFGDTVQRILARRPNLRVLAPAAPSAKDKLAEIVAAWPGRPLIMESAERFDAFAAADAALAASGTVAAELAIFNTPMVVAYRTDLLTEIWARHVLTTPYVSLVNIAAGRALVPEFLQRDCEPDGLAAALLPLLEEGPQREAQRAAFPAIVEGWTGAEAPASVLAANAILEWTETGKTQ